MERLRGYYDRFALTGHFTLNWAIFYEVCYVSLVYVGTYIVLGAARQQTYDRGLLCMGVAIILIGALGMFHAAQVIHAVVRRLVADSRSQR
jgi:hypothetical protein